MEKAIIDFIENHMMNHIILIALCVAATIGAMAVDLVSGVQKAKQRGEARTSTGYKKTATEGKEVFHAFPDVVFYRHPLLRGDSHSGVLDVVDGLLHFL